jgi:hypothetical protein
MSLIFLLLKAFEVWSTPYDYVIFLGLVGLDINNLFTYLRWYRVRNR